MSGALALRRTSVAAGSLLLVVALGGCGGSDKDSPGKAAFHPAGKGAATHALLTAQDVSSDYTASGQSSQSTGQVGCLSATDDLAQVAAQVDVKSGFVRSFTGGYSGVLSEVRSDPDPDLLAKAYADLVDTVTHCDSVQASSGGVDVDLKITTDDDAVADGSDQQVHVDGVGTLSSTPSGGTPTSVDYHVGFDISLVAGSLVTVAAYDLGPSDAPAVPALADLDKIVIGRLADAPD